MKIIRREEDNLVRVNQAHVEHAPPNTRVETWGRHTELSRNVPPFPTLHSVKKDPSIDSEDTPSHADTPSIRSYSLRFQESNSESKTLKRYLINYPYLSDYGQTIFLSFFSVKGLSNRIRAM